MSSSRRQVYVEILYDSKKRKAEKRRSPEPGPSTLPALRSVVSSPTLPSRKRLKPYVEILYDPNKRTAQNQRSAEREISISPSLSVAVPSPNRTPRKRRKLSPGRKDGISYNDSELPIYPTASEFGQVTPGSGYDSVPPETRSPTFSIPDAGNWEDEIDTASASNRGIDGLERCVYNLAEDDLEENEDLVVRGEDQEDDEEAGDLPVRLLYDFAIYTAHTQELVSVAELLQLDYSAQKYRASGLVRPWADQDREDSDNDEPEGDDDDSDMESVLFDHTRDRVGLSEVIEFSIHAPSDGEHRIDPKIYLRTKHAWYILGTPSESYRDHFYPFWICHRMLHLLVMACIKNSRITSPEFVATIPQLDQSEDLVVGADTILGRPLEEADLKSDDVTTYIVSTLPDVCAESGIRISRVPLVRDLMGPTHYEFDTRTNLLGPTQRHRKGPGATKTKSVPSQQSKTFLTPTVNRIAQDFFEGSLEVAQSALDDESNEEPNREAYNHKGHYSNPESIHWGKRLGHYQGYYRSVEVDGITYRVGDVIMVAPESMNSSQSRAYSVNKYANKWWFCQIRYFFESEGNIKMFHGLWFNHGSKTLLQETSHSEALYLLDSCDDNRITSIVKKCNFKVLLPGDKEMIDDGASKSNDFHCGLFCSQDDGGAFIDVPEDALNVNPGEKSCFACCLKEETSAKEVIQQPDTNTIILHGTTYHVSDFVYLIPANSTKLLDIGQVVKIDNIKAVVNLLGRYNDYLSQKDLDDDDDDLVYDERRLFYTEQQLTVPLRKLSGKCFVQHLTNSANIERWIKNDDHFYLNQRGSTSEIHPMKLRDFTFCEICYADSQASLKKVRNFKRTNSKLIGFELFSGAGGLGVGMDLSGYVETKYAVEFSPSAAKTYMENHPNTTVYCQDSNALLKHALMGTRGPLRSLDGKTNCPPLPDKHDQVDFIFGGPPCQSFSLANHSKRRDDIRSTMSCNMLSYVEHYEPSYFLLENVFGFLTHKFYAKRETDNGVVETEIQGGMIKFVVRTLIALGYQVRFKVLQAAQYGVPQSRRRVIFWGAKRGLPLPDFPVPVYAFEKGMHKTNLPTGSKLNPPTRSRDPDDPHQYAPLQPITVNAAIGDLPKFDWLNPHIIHPQTRKDRLEAQRRREALGIPSFHAVGGMRQDEGPWSAQPGFPAGGAYCMAPQNRFQQWLRREMGDEDAVTGQYTAKFNARIVEATCTVPLIAGACHRDLPADLLPQFAQKKNSKISIYGRMDGTKYFQCAVTQLSPQLKNQWPLHPSQKRIITVREAARCQGFPDNYIFASIHSQPRKIIEDQLKQIGNAVAVPFALALGKELGKALILAWEKKEREGSVSL